MRFLEDIEVGMTARFGAYPVTREDVIEFARRFDPQPFHLSDEAAARTHFGRLAASGWHTCAMTMAMIVEEGRKDPIAGLGSPGIDQLRWVKPVYPGDTLSVELEVTEVTHSRSRPDMGSYRSDTTVLNQHGEVVMTMNSAVLVRCRPAFER